MRRCPVGKDCDEALDHLFEYIDHEMPEDELMKIGSHLKGCPPCEAELKINEKIKSLVNRTGGDVAPTELRERVLSTIREAREA